MGPSMVPWSSFNVGFYGAAFLIIPFWAPEPAAVQLGTIEKELCHEPAGTRVQPRLRNLQSNSAKLESEGQMTYVLVCVRNIDHS